jgi:hypothetical protein
MPKMPIGDQALWSRTKSLVAAGGLENMLEILMQETGWNEKQARKYAGLALKHCAVDYHGSRMARDRNIGLVWAGVALALFVLIQALGRTLSSMTQIAPPVILSIGIYFLLRSLKTGAMVTRARRKLPPPPHEQP